jgi:uncharacterized protein with HEPN domain
LKSNSKNLVKDILNGIDKIEDSIKGRSLEEFARSAKMQDTIVCRLKIIGEDARQIPNDFKEKNAEVPWYRITEIMNQLAYQSIGFKPVDIWVVVKKDLPLLREKILKIYRK